MNRSNTHVHLGALVGSGVPSSIYCSQRFIESAQYIQQDILTMWTDGQQKLHQVFFPVVVYVECV